MSSHRRQRSDSTTQLVDRFPDCGQLVSEIEEMLRTAPSGPSDTSHNDLGYGFGSFSPRFLRHMGEQGLIGTTWPPSLGGRGMSVRALQVVFTMLASHGAPAEAVFYVEAVGSMIAKLGNADLQAGMLPGFLSGRTTVVEALTEPDAGSDLFAMATRAERTPDGDYRVTGNKIWTSNGWAADTALVAVRTGEHGGGARGISTLLIDLDAPGVSRRPIVDASGDASFGELSFVDVHVPAHRLVGQEGEGRKPVIEALEWDRLWARFVKAPYLRSELDQLWSACRSAESAEPLDSHTVSMLAGIGIDIEVCAAAFDACIDDLQTDGSVDLARVSGLKLMADELGRSFFDTAQDVLGTHVPGADDASRRLHARFARLALASHGLLIAGGAPDIQRITIAQRGLGMPRS